MKEEAAKREAELAAQSESTPQVKESTEDMFEFTEVDMSWDEVPAGMYETLKMIMPKMQNRMHNRLSMVYNFTVVENER